MTQFVYATFLDVSVHVTQFVWVTLSDFCGAAQLDNVCVQVSSAVCLAVGGLTSQLHDGVLKVGSAQTIILALT